MPIFLHCLALQFYKGIGQEVQKLGPFKEFNFFIGANNSGKSTVLEFLHKHLPAGSQPKRQTFGGLEQYRGAVTGRTLAAVGLPTRMFIDASLGAFRADAYRHRFESHVKKISEALAEDNVIWFKIPEAPEGAYDYLRAPDIHKFAALFPIKREWHDLWNGLTGSSGGSLEHWIPHTIAHLRQAQSIFLPRVQHIPAIREIGPKAQEFSDFSGKGLIDKLAEIQSPDHNKRQDRRIFDRINEFLQSVTDRPSAQIEVPHNREHLLVHMDNKVLPLQSLGTGIHEVIMIAAFCTISEKHIVCIEEPEIHLHPLLQRKLVAYLQKNTSNQYFIATHSAAFIDTPNAAIFHVRNDGAQTLIRESLLRKERVAICADLGVRASDIVQSNAVVWVEGPSDRIYLRHWLQAVAPDLIEGTHYSIMFYGGRLLNHLSADDEEISEFIALRSLNQNLALLMDSDLSSSRGELNETKKRLRDEFSRGSGTAWVTKGREIENYINHEILQAAVREAHPHNYDSPANEGGPFTHSLHFKMKRHKTVNGRKVPIETNIDKVKVAKIVCAQQPDLHKLDLTERLEEVTRMIQAANR